MVYDRMLLRKKGYEGVLYSYFATESERTYSIPADSHPVPEENLWLMVRELNGVLCDPGESKKITMIPSMWSRRKTHKEASTVPVVIRKSHFEEFHSILGAVKAVKFTWTAEDASTTVIVEERYPHRILAFTEPDGSLGKLQSIRRLPYWKLHDNDDVHLRRELGLTSSMPAPE
jgi:hypothetical protein